METVSSHDLSHDHLPSAPADTATSFLAEEKTLDGPSNDSNQQHGLTGMCAHDGDSMRSCSLCGETGHNRRTCPKPPNVELLDKIGLGSKPIPYKRQEGEGEGKGVVFSQFHVGNVNAPFSYLQAFAVGTGLMNNPQTSSQLAGGLHSNLMMSPNGRVVAISAPDGSSNTEEMIKSAEDAERQAKERTAAALERKRIAEEMLETALAEAQVAERKLEEALARKAALLGVSVTSLSGDKGDVDHNADTESDSEKNNAGSKRSRSAFQADGEQAGRVLRSRGH